jgi:hypothetical protein
MSKGKEKRKNETNKNVGSSNFHSSSSNAFFKHIIYNGKNM